MKTFLVGFVAAMVLTGTAFAGEDAHPASAPTIMTDAQMDQVVAGDEPTVLFTNGGVIIIEFATGDFPPPLVLKYGEIIN